MAKGNQTVEKVKRRSLTIKQKVEILQRLKEKKITKSDLAKEFGVDRATIRKIELHEKPLLQKASMSNTGNLKRKYVASGKYQQLEQALFYWFLQKRDKHEIITTNLLRMQARKFSNALNIPESFKFSTKWIHNFKKRFGIRKLKITGEKLSSDSKSVEPFKSEFFHRVYGMNLLAAQIYNADESALFFKMLPNYSLVHNDETSASGCKVAKERVTFLPCANADGTHKLPMLLIGKSKKPRAFKDVQLPLDYASSKNAWMTRFIFKQWFFETFIPHVRKFSSESKIEAKALLLLDNCSAHHFEDELISDDGLITVIFLPPNVTPLLQPMDQHVIQMVKTKYREKLHNEIVFGNLDPLQRMKQINLRHASFWLQEAWMDVSQTVLQSSWKNIGIVVGNKLMHEDDIPLKTLFNIAENEETNANINEHIDKEMCVDEYTDADFIEMVTAEDSYAPDGGEENEDVDESQTASMVVETIPLTEPSTSRNEQAVNCLTFAIEWAEENSFDLNDIFHLRKIKNAALQKCVQN